MCGIVGKINFNNQKITSEEIAEMNKVLSHRGPNNEGIFLQGNIGLGHKRLSIMDLSPAGHQPMSDETKKIWIVFNGEIYNFQELKKELSEDGCQFKSQTDTEVIIYLYKKYGTECLKKMRGMFAFAIWDETKKELFLAKDRLGKKPLKYYYDKNTFIFSSELKAILSQTEVKKEIDTKAINEYLTFGYVPAPQTGFKNIYKLEPGHYIIIKPTGEIIKKKYWNLDFSKKINLSENEWGNKITAKIKESIKMRMIADVPIGAHLSGGIDSGLIVALMSEQSTKPIKTYSIGFKEEKYNELPYAKLIANKYKTDHHEIIIEPNAVEILPKLAYYYEEPFADNSSLPTWYLCEATKKDITVVLNGDGGDEAFGGYYRYQAMVIYDLLQKTPLLKNGLFAINKFIPESSRIKKLLSNLNFKPLDAYINTISIFDREEKQKISNTNFEINKNYFEKKDFALIDQIFYWGIKTHLSDDLIPKVDIASMANSLEIRSPFLDQELVELCASMPSNLKTKYNNKKYLLKKIALEYLPKECVNRPKKGFDAPLEFWFRDKLGEIFRSYLNENRLAVLGINKKAVEEILEQHLTHKKNNAKKIWSLLMLFAWYNKYFE